MVVALRPGKFYGSSLPRPRFYSNPNGERVDPPVFVLDPFLSWAEEAHWSMGGLSFKRLHLQGRIEGNINKLRDELEKIEKKVANKNGSTKGKRKMRLVDEFDAAADEINDVEVEKRGLARKLDDDFDRVAEESAPIRRTRSARNEDVVVDVVNKVKTTGRRLVKSSEKKSGSVTPRTSRRLLKCGSS